jgi:hypothetical protein
MIDYVETKLQPITMAMVLKEYGIVRANKDGAGVDGMTWAKLHTNMQVQDRINENSFCMKNSDRSSK